MISYQAFTQEIDNLELAVNELVDKISDKKLLKNSCGIVFADYDVDCAELSRLLNKKLNFPFIGSTVLASLDTAGYKEAGISLLVMTADDCDFSVEITEKLEHIEDNRLINSYRQASERLPEKEKVIITYLPWSQNIVFDEVVKLLDDEAGGVPVFGGICADGWSFDKAQTFCNGEAGLKRGVLLLICGNINPIFLRNHSAMPLEYEAVVTSAEGNVLYTVDDKPVKEYLSEFGLLYKEEDSIGSFLATPFIISRRTKCGDRIEILRSIVDYIPETGGLSMVGGIMRGDIITISFISKKLILDSLSEEFDKLISKMSGDQSFSTMLCSSCAGRYSLIVGNKEIEAASYMNKIPEGVNLQGAYLFGECCPVRGESTGKLMNAFNNETFAIMAF